MFAELIYSTMEKIAVFPGSFDPFTVGHEEIVRRGLKLFDKIIIAVGVNPVKKEFLDTDCRIRLIRKAFEDTDRVTVEPYFGLTVDFCRQVNAHIIIRGLRTAADFEYERAVGQANRAMDGRIETYQACFYDGISGGRSFVPRRDQPDYRCAEGTVCGSGYR